MKAFIFNKSDEDFQGKNGAEFLLVIDRFSLLQHHKYLRSKGKSSIEQKEKNLFLDYGNKENRTRKKYYKFAQEIARAFSFFSTRTKRAEGRKVGIYTTFPLSLKQHFQTSANLKQESRNTKKIFLSFLLSIQDQSNSKLKDQQNLNIFYWNVLSITL